MKNNSMHTFGFAATQTAQKFVAEMVRGLQAAADAGFTAAPAMAYATVGQKRAMND